LVKLSFQIRPQLIAATPSFDLLGAELLPAMDLLSREDDPVSGRIAGVVRAFCNTQFDPIPIHAELERRIAAFESAA
jgi:hypothetical protein